MEEENTWQFLFKVPKIYIKFNFSADNYFSLLFYSYQS